MNEWYGDGDDGSHMRTEVRKFQIRQNAARDRLLRSNRNAMRDADDQRLIEELDEDDHTDLSTYERVRPLHVDVIAEVHLVMARQMVELQALRYAFKHASRWGTTTEALYAEAENILRALKFDDAWQGQNSGFWHGWTWSAEPGRSFPFQYPLLKTTASIDQPDEVSALKQNVVDKLEERWPAPSAELSQDEIDKKINSLYGRRNSFGKWAHEWAPELHTQRTAFLGALKALAARRSNEEEAIIASIDATIIDGYKAHLSEASSLLVNIVYQIEQSRTPHRTGLTPEASLNSVSYQDSHLPARERHEERQRAQQSAHLAAQLKELELRRSRTLYSRIKSIFK